MTVSPVIFEHARVNLLMSNKLHDTKRYCILLYLLRLKKHAILSKHGIVPVLSAHGKYL